jgi:hypothetical protein
MPWRRAEQNDVAALQVPEKPFIIHQAFFFLSPRQIPPVHVEDSKTMKSS